MRCFRLAGERPRGILDVPQSLIGGRRARKGDGVGRLTYDGGVRVELDDRVLSHVQVVIGTKLRRNEPFFFTWQGDVSTGGGRTAVWLHSGAGLVFWYYGGRPPRLNRTWLEALMRTANSPAGLQIVPEPPEAGGGAEPLE